MNGTNIRIFLVIKAANSLPSHFITAKHPGCILAKELEKHLDISAPSWLNMQQRYNEAYEEAVAKLELIKA